MALPARCTCSKRCVKRVVRKHAVLLANIVAIVIGLVLGFGIRPANPSADVIAWIGLFGEVFINMVKMLILPIIVVNLILGVSSLEAKASGRLGVYSLLYILVTQVIGCVIGICMGLAFRPGAGLAEGREFTLKTQPTNYGDVFSDLIRNLFPSNLIRATFKQVRTQRSTEVINATLNITKETRELTLQSGMNTIGITVFSVLVGFAAVAIGKKAKPFIDLLLSLNEIINWLMKFAMWYSPVGIASLIASSILKVPDIQLALASLGILILSTLVGVLIHQLLIIHPLYFIIVRKNPYKYHFRILDGLLAASAPPGSIFAMPYLLKSLDEKQHLDNRVTKFFIPIGLNLNRDMSVMFICLCAMFCAQTYGVTLNAGSLIAIVFMVTALSFAIASVPSSSVVLLLMLSSVTQVPIAERVGLIMTVEWINDRMRTVGNVVSTAFGCGIVEKMVKKQLRDSQPEPEEEMAAGKNDVSNKDDKPPSQPLLTGDAV